MFAHFHSKIVIAPVFASLLLTGCGDDDTEQVIVPEPDPAWMTASASGGDTTNFTGNQSSFGFDTPAANLADAALALHLTGDTEFETKFIKAVSDSFPEQDGLGPVLNNDSCNDCHARDGRGNYTLAALQADTGDWTKLGAEESVFLRISINAGDDDCATPTSSNNYCAPQAVPGFSAQLFHRGVLGLRNESPFTGQADVYVSFTASTVTYPDGRSVTLRKPQFQIRNPYDFPGEAPGDYTPAISRLLQSDVATSPRMSPPVFGLGLLEAIPEADILANVDAGDGNNDGISGRANWVFDPVENALGSSNPVSLGRFGWKASTPSVLVQSAGAYHGDIGVTNYLNTEESIVRTALHDTYLAGNPNDNGQAANGYEVSEKVVKAVAFYSNTLAVPGRRNVNDATVLSGARLFKQINCSGCHTPSFTTGAHPGIWGPSGVTAVDVVVNQVIYPYTDLLLHDMGEDLADHRTDFQATGKEWRTRPLWGIGLTQTVNPLATFLHDGRARTLEEAILWHGGEAETSKQSFMSLSQSEREAVLAFLGSL